MYIYIPNGIEPTANYLIRLQYDVARAFQCMQRIIINRKCSVRVGGTVMYFMISVAIVKALSVTM